MSRTRVTGIGGTRGTGTRSARRTGGSRSSSGVERAAAPGRLAGLTLAAAALLLSAQVSAAPLSDYVVSVNSDYDVSGRVATLDVLAPWSVDDPVASVHSDADARYHDGLVYVVNHLYADNIQVLDPEQSFATVLQFSVGPGSNPQDIAFLSDARAYVSRHERTHLLDVDATTGAVNDSIDLSPLADADGIPEMSAMAVHGGYLFVAVQRLDRDYYWVPVPPSCLAVIDTATNTLVDVDGTTPGVQGIELPFTNPYRDIHVDETSGLMYVACSGSWSSLDGAIVEVDPVSLQVTGTVATESQLGGELYDFTLPLGARAHAVVSTSTPDWEQFCVAFDWSTGEKIGDVWKPGGYSVMDVEMHEGSGQLFVSDRSYASPGVRVFDAAEGSQLTTGPLAASLPPHDLLVVGDAITSVEPGGDGASLALSVKPNPVEDRCELAFTVPRAGEVRAAVHDVSGRLVRVLADGAFSAGRARLEWDGRAGSGEAVASGVYFVSVETPDLIGRSKVLVVR
ncbi:MAG: hypothetical protein GF400_04800 [Candidatus Eisenbacteria bacterium]|nr:hypothetical protein [Candidatus Eisenbacteria bacterium]